MSKGLIIKDDINIDEFNKLKRANQPGLCMPVIEKAEFPQLQEQDLKSLLRFYETTSDDKTYDLDEIEISRLIEIGVLFKNKHVYITSIGQYFINRHFGLNVDCALMTEADINDQFNRNLSDKVI